MKYRRRPYLVEAIKWTGDLEKLNEKWIIDAISQGKLSFTPNTDPKQVVLKIHSGKIEVEIERGSYILKGVDEEIHIYNEEEFLVLYDDIDKNKKEIPEKVDSLVVLVYANKRLVDEYSNYEMGLLAFGKKNAEGLIESETAHWGEYNDLARLHLAQAAKLCCGFNKRLKEKPKGKKKNE